MNDRVSSAARSKARPRRALMKLIDGQGVREKNEPVRARTYADKFDDVRSVASVADGAVLALHPDVRLLESLRQR
jgi:hypothetical protein